VETLTGGDFEMHDYYKEFLSDSLVESLFARVTPVDGVALLPLDVAEHQETSGNFQDVLNEVNWLVLLVLLFQFFFIFCKDARTARQAALKFESLEALSFVAHCFRKVRAELDAVLEQRMHDREWTDKAVLAANAPGLGPLSGPLGQVEAGTKNHVPFGPHNPGARFVLRVVL
jgi:hypothetical protein